MQKRPNKPGSRRAGPPKRAAGAPRVTWSGFRPLFDFWGNEIPRFYQLETLARAVEFSVERRERVIVPSVQSVLGPAPVTTLQFELFQEGKYQLIFRARAMNARRNSAQFALVAAKRPGDYSAVAANEHQNLRLLNERTPEYVVKPYLGGRLFMPDRFNRPGQGREIYIYLTQWQSGYHELGVTRQLQFFINTRTPHTFTIAQTEQLQGEMVEIIARTYSDTRHDCMALPEIASGDFVVTPPPKSGKPKLKLIACRALMRRVTPPKLIHRIAEASWDWGGRQFKIIPPDPRMTFDAFVRARGAEQAKLWFRDYVDAVEKKKLPELEPLPVGELKRLA